MDDKTLLDQLEQLAITLDIAVRYETTFDDLPPYHGGLCRLKDHYVVIIEKNSSTAQKVKTLGRALSRFDLEPFYVRPGLRAFLSGFLGR